MRLVLVTAQPPRPGLVAETRAKYGATGDGDSVRFETDRSIDEHLIATWRWLAAHRVGFEWLAVVNVDSVKPVDKFRRKMDQTLRAADSLVVALHVVNVDTAEAEPVGLAIAADVVGDLTSTLSLRRPLWPQIQNWCDRRGRTIQHVEHLLHPERFKRASSRSQRPHAGPSRL